MVTRAGTPERRSRVQPPSPAPRRARTRASQSLRVGQTRGARYSSERARELADDDAAASPGWGSSPATERPDQKPAAATHIAQATARKRRDRLEAPELLRFERRAKRIGDDCSRERMPEQTGATRRARSGLQL